MRSRRGFIGGMVGTTTIFAGCAGILENSNDSDGDNGDSNTTTGNSGPDPEQQRYELAMTYRGGISSYRAGDAGYQNGTLDYNVEMFESAEDIYSEAVTTLQEAENQFSQAGTAAIELDETTVLEWCDEAQEKAATMRSAAELMVNASQHAQDGELQAADADSRSSNDSRQSAEQITIRDLADVETALSVDVPDPTIPET